MGGGAIEILSFSRYTGKQELGGIRVWSGQGDDLGLEPPVVLGIHVSVAALTLFSSRWERPNSEIKSCLNSSQHLPHFNIFIKAYCIINL